MKTTDPFSLQGRRFLVTGGTRGIGRSVSLQFARAGAAVIANFVRDVKSAEELLNEALGENLALELCRADLTHSTGLGRLKAHLESENRPLNGMVHCAATGVHKSIQDLTGREFDWTFALNVRAFLDVFHLILPRLSAPASIVAVSSLGAMRAVPGYAMTGASKAALESLARGMAAEFCESGIRINVIRPGSVLTDVWKHVHDGEQRLNEARKRTPLRRLVSAEEVALGVQFLCSEASRGIVGHTLIVDGGASIVE